MLSVDGGSSSYQSYRRQGEGIGLSGAKGQSMVKQLTGMYSYVRCVN